MREEVTKLVFSADKANKVRIMKEILPNKNPGYWKHTEKCPHCYGRGRVAKDGYGLEPDVYKDVYEEEKAIEEAQSIIDGK
ncbi:hypothetical protein LCGC14_1767410 [marine sediment metagenome]|uniref:Uncharacterized protein n=1 Tax=marine sediment metagenome TaxID=412755 RepID=A0A0F9JE32_9ZZZZ